MKLIQEANGIWQYELSKNEADVLQGLVKKFPFTNSYGVKISKADNDPAVMEREKLLNESLAEHRNELKTQALSLVADSKFKQSETGQVLQLDSDGREVLLQILNDIRVGSWHILGEPQNLELKADQFSKRGQAYRNLMDLAGYFEENLIAPD